MPETKIINDDDLMRRPKNIIEIEYQSWKQSWENISSSCWLLSSLISLSLSLSFFLSLSLSIYISIYLSRTIALSRYSRLHPVSARRVCLKDSIEERPYFSSRALHVFFILFVRWEVNGCLATVYWVLFSGSSLETSESKERYIIYMSWKNTWNIHKFQSLNNNWDAEEPTNGNVPEGLYIDLLWP